MTQSSDTIPEAIEPLYTMVNPNESIILFKGTLVFEHNGMSFTDTSGMIEVCWAIRPRIDFTCSCDFPCDFPLELDTATITIPDIGWRYNVSIEQSIILANKSIQYKGSIYSRIPCSETEHYHGIQFHVPNFVQFVHGHCQGRAGWMSRGRLVLEYRAWHIVLNTNQHTTKMVKQLKQTGGYGLTHTGLLQRTDKSNFTLEEASIFLKRFHLFLSFLRGFWTGTMLLVAFDTTHQSVPLWGDGCKLSPYRPVLSWFPAHRMTDTDVLQELFHTFMTKMDDKQWEYALRVSIHWYIEANLQAGGLEGAIILTQAALELLSWTYFVLSEKKYSKTKFENRSVEDNIGLWLEELHLPVTIPSSLKNIIKQSPDKNGPEVLTSLRNDFVHKDNKNKTTISIDEKADIWLLGLWYVELSLLFCCGYRGMYLPRFLDEPAYVGDCDIIVPWNE